MSGASQPVTHARYFINPENRNYDCIEVQRGSHTDFVYTHPKGNWSELKFEYADAVSYADFLKAMVHGNVDVCRKIALLRHQMVLDKAIGIYVDTRLCIKLMNCLKILDPTFEPPTVNIKCKWQKKLMMDIIKYHSVEVIKNNMTMSRLDRYANVLQVL